MKAIIVLLVLAFAVSANIFALRGRFKPRPKPQPVDPIDLPTLPAQFSSNPISERDQMKIQRLLGLLSKKSASKTCCAFHWIFVVDNSDTTDVINHQSIQWLFKTGLTLGLSAQCSDPQRLSTISHCNISTVEQENTTLADFNHLLPTGVEGSVTNYSVAMTAALNLISSYMDMSTCVVFISDGGSTEISSQIQLYNMTRKQMKENGFCMCSICLSTGGQFDRFFYTTCRRIRAKYYRSANEWALGERLIKEASNQLFKRNCCSRS